MMRVMMKAAIKATMKATMRVRMLLSQRLLLMPRPMPRLPLMAGTLTSKHLTFDKCININGFKNQRIHHLSTNFSCHAFRKRERMPIHTVRCSRVSSSVGSVFNNN